MPPVRPRGVPRTLFGTLALAPLLLPPGCVAVATAAWRAGEAENVVGFWRERYASSTVHTMSILTLLAIVVGLLVLMVSRYARAMSRHVLTDGMPGLSAVVLVAAVLSWVASQALHMHATMLFQAGYEHSLGGGPTPPPGSWRSIGESSYALFMAGWILFAGWVVTWACIAAARPLATPPD